VGRATVKAGAKVRALAASSERAGQGSNPCPAFNNFAEGLRMQIYRVKVYFNDGRGEVFDDVLDIVEECQLPVLKLICAEVDVRIPFRQIKYYLVDGGREERDDPISKEG